MSKQNEECDGVTDPFDPTALRLDQSFADGPAVKKLLTTIPVRKPGAQDFIRVHPNAEYRLDTAVLSLKDDKETYLVAPTLVPELITECVPVSLYTTVSRQGVLTLWPIRLPGPDGKMNEWWRSAREAAEIAMESWVRVKASTSLNTYEIFRAAGAIQRMATGQSRLSQSENGCARSCNRLPMMGHPI
jgi:hypothetical protein